MADGPSPLPQITEPVLPRQQGRQGQFRPRKQQAPQIAESSGYSSRSSESSRRHSPSTPDIGQHSPSIATTEPTTPTGEVFRPITINYSRSNSPASDVLKITTLKSEPKSPRHNRPTEKKLELVSAQKQSSSGLGQKYPTRSAPAPQRQANMLQKPPRSPPTDDLKTIQTKPEPKPPTSLPLQTDFLGELSNAIVSPRTRASQVQMIIPGPNERAIDSPTSLCAAESQRKPAPLATEEVLSPEMELGGRRRSPEEPILSSLATKLMSPTRPNKLKIPPPTLPKPKLRPKTSAPSMYYNSGNAEIYDIPRIHRTPIQGRRVTIGHKPSPYATPGITFHNSALPSPTTQGQRLSYRASNNNSPLSVSLVSEQGPGSRRPSFTGSQMASPAMTPTGRPYRVSMSSAASSPMGSPSIPPWERCTPKVAPWEKHAGPNYTKQNKPTFSPGFAMDGDVHRTVMQKTMSLQGYQHAGTPRSHRRSLQASNPVDDRVPMPLNNNHNESPLRKVATVKPNSSFTDSPYNSFAEPLQTDGPSTQSQEKFKAHQKTVDDVKMDKLKLLSDKIDAEMSRSEET